MRGRSVFAIDPNIEIASKISLRLDASLEIFDQARFPDGEIKLSSKRDVSERDVYLVHTLCASQLESVNDRLCQLCFMLSALRDRGCASLTAIIPYFCYARSDTRKVSNDPLTFKYMARMIEECGAQKVIGLDVHNVAAFENAFRCKTTHAQAAKLFSENLKDRFQEASSLLVLSPDFGGIKRAAILGNYINLNSNLGFLEKRRDASGLSGRNFVGEASGRDVLIVDDMISTGATALRAVEACRQRGARKIILAATHGLFTKNKRELLDNKYIEEVLVTDSNPELLGPIYEEFRVTKKLRVLSCAEILANATQESLD